MSTDHSLLIIEDEQDIRNTLRQLLELEGFEVILTANGQEALNYLQDPAHPQPSLILLDLMMPILNGWEFLEIRKQTPSISSIPVIVVSAMYDSAKTVQADGFVKKPIELSYLLSAIHAHLP